MILDIIFLFFAGTFFLVSLINLISYPIFEYTTKQVHSKIYSSTTQKKVSLLVPCRNEENVIASCIRSLCTQKYANKEIIVYDDNSTDASVNRLRSLQKEYDFTLLQGKSLPKNWMGKQHACHQLAQHATGDYLCFIDADVSLHPETLSKALSFHQGGLLSIFPHQIKKTFGEYLIVPFMHWLLFSVLPFPTIRHFKSKAYVAASGQFMLFEKNCYQHIGGHAAVRQDIVEDMALARRVKEHSYPVQTLHSTRLVSCRMYDGFRSAFQGFQKNLFAGFRRSRLLFILQFLLTGFAFFAPFFFLHLPAAQLAVTLLILNQICIALLEKDFSRLLLFPLQQGLFIFIGLSSAVRRTKQWKGRTY